MAGYLDEYGQADQRREGVLKRIVLAAVVLIAVAGVLYFQFRNFREERQLKSFQQLLTQGDYKQAYELWGCTESEPCPHYKYEKFLEDWGPDSDYHDVSSAEILKTRTCSDGIIQIWRFAEDDDVRLFVDKAERVISFAPWETCNPRYSPAELTGQ